MKKKIIHVTFSKMTSGKNTKYRLLENTNNISKLDHEIDNLNGKYLPANLLSESENSSASSSGYESPGSSPTPSFSKIGNNFQKIYKKDEEIMRDSFKSFHIDDCCVDIPPRDPWEDLANTNLEVSDAWKNEFCSFNSVTQQQQETNEKFFEAFTNNTVNYSYSPLSNYNSFPFEPECKLSPT